jgi:predicted DNA-binding ribbon-helix-helix protein
MWCNVVHIVFQEPAMAVSRRQHAQMSETKSARTSVTFPVELYETLERIARDQKVSVAWVVRDAAEKYVDERWPLLGRQGR